MSSSAIPIVILAVIGGAVCVVAMRSIGAQLREAGAVAALVCVSIAYWLSRVHQPAASASANGPPPESAPVQNARAAPPARHCVSGLTVGHAIAHGSLDVALDEATGTPVRSPATVSRGATIVLRGWAADAAVHHPIVAVCVTVGGVPLAHETISYGGARPDVSAAFHQAALTNTAFEVHVPTADLRIGSQTLEIVGIDADRRAEAIVPPLVLNVR